jgi:hypothetical protein
MTTRDRPPPFQRGLKTGPQSIVRFMSVQEDQLPGTIDLPDDMGPGLTGKPMVSAGGITTAMKQMTSPAARNPVFKPPR